MELVNDQTTDPGDEATLREGYKAPRFLAVLLQATQGKVCEAVVSYYQGFATLQHIGTLPESQVYVRSVLGLRPRFR